MCVVFAEISLRISAVGSQKKGLESGQKASQLCLRIVKQNKHRRHFTNKINKRRKLWLYRMSFYNNIYKSQVLTISCAFEIQKGFKILNNLIRILRPLTG